MSGTCWKREKAKKFFIPILVLTLLGPFFVRACCVEFRFANFIQKLHV